MGTHLKEKLKIKNIGIKLTVTFAFAICVMLLYVSNIGCVFRRFFGIVCPGCGLTRALISLFQLDFSASFTYHPFLFTVPLLYLYFLYDGHIFGKVADVCIPCGIFLAFFVRWILLFL